MPPPATPPKAKPPTAAAKLSGYTLEGGWEVVRHIDLSSTTGGCFSEAYIVKDKRGDRAFLKALDYSRALQAHDPASELQRLTESYNFERGLLQLCRSRRFDRVVSALADGKVTVAGEVVQYIIFELADGDLHDHADVLTELDIAWILRSLHHVATGIRQLHSQDIAHQDVKPSNVLVFNRDVSKLADLGRSARRGAHAPHDSLTIAGDATYAPPELLYGYLLPDWSARRLGCDLYLLGSMISSVHRQKYVSSNASGIPGSARRSSSRRRAWGLRCRPPGTP